MPHPRSSFSSSGGRPRRPRPVTGLIDRVTEDNLTVNGLAYPRNKAFEGSWPTPEAVGLLCELTFAPSDADFSILSVRFLAEAAEGPASSLPPRFPLSAEAMDLIVERAQMQGLDLEALAELIRIRFRKRPSELDALEGLRLIDFLGD
jgi:hypothetical protein